MAIQDSIPGACTQRYSRIIMLGTGGDGGIAALVASYRAHGLFSRWPVHYIPTCSEGGALRKLAVTAAAVVRVALTLLRDRRAVFHIHGASHASFWRNCIFMSMALAARCPVILHLHGGGFARFYECESSGAGRAAIRFFLGRVTCVLSLSERWRRWVSELSPSVQVVRIGNPAPDVALVPGTGRRSMILFMGRLEPREGIYDLLQALSALRLQLPEATLVCAGDGDQRPVRRFCERHGIADAVCLTGSIGDDEKRALLQRAAALVVPYHTEAMPMSVLDAMAAKVPVVAPAVGAVPDVVTDGVDGLLFQPGDVPSLHRLLCRLLHDPALGARLAAQARSNITSRDPAERVLAQLGSLYASIGLERCPEPAGALHQACTSGEAA